MDEERRLRNNARRKELRANLSPEQKADIKAKQKIASAKYYASGKALAKLREYRAANAERIREYTRQSVKRWRAAHPEAAAVASLDWRVKNREKARIAAAEWREKNRERHLAGKRAYYEAKRAERVAKSAEWQKANPIKVAIRAGKRRARLKSCYSTLSSNLIDTLLSEQDSKCTYCALPFTKRRRPSIDHFMPLALGGRHADENIVLCCHRCNCRKRHSHPLDFLRRIGLLDERKSQPPTGIPAKRENYATASHPELPL